MMYRLLIYANRFFLLSLLVLFSCKQEPKATIGLLMDDYEQERWLKDRDIFIAKALELNVTVIDSAARSDDQKQIEIAKWMLTQGIDMLVVVAVNFETAGKIVELAHEAGVKVMAYDRLIMNADLDFFISTNTIDIGRSQASSLTKLCPEGKYVLIGGASTDKNSYILHEGQMQILQPLIDSGKIEICYDRYVDFWVEEDAYKYMKICLEECNNINAVIAGNDDLVTGVLKALEEKGLAGKVLISGQDADLAACKRIVNGTQTMTIYKPIRDLAEKAAEFAVTLALGQEVEVELDSIDNGKVYVPALFLETKVVNVETLPNTVYAEGYHNKDTIE